MPEAKPTEWFFGKIDLLADGAIVVLDDDEYVHRIWNSRFSSDFLLENNITLFYFSNSENFMKVAHYYSYDTIIYIDSSLDNGVKGEDIAKVLYEKGYANLILATGHPKFHFTHVTWVKDIVGKEPPWDK